MGQKTNPNILWLGVVKNWHSKYIEKKSSEISFYDFTNLEIKKFMDKFFKTNKLLVHSCKLSYSESNVLVIFVSYYVMPEYYILSKIYDMKHKKKLKQKFSYKKKKKFKFKNILEFILKKNINRKSFYTVFEKNNFSLKKKPFDKTFKYLLTNFKTVELKELDPWTNFLIKKLYNQKIRLNNWISIQLYYYFTYFYYFFRFWYFNFILPKSKNIFDFSWYWKVIWIILKKNFVNKTLKQLIRNKKFYKILLNTSLALKNKSYFNFFFFVKFSKLLKFNNHKQVNYLLCTNLTKNKILNSTTLLFFAKCELFYFNVSNENQYYNSTIIAKFFKISFSRVFLNRSFFIFYLLRTKQINILFYTIQKFLTLTLNKQIDKLKNLSLIHNTFLLENNKFYIIKSPTQNLYSHTNFCFFSSKIYLLEKKSNNLKFWNQLTLFNENFSLNKIIDITEENFSKNYTNNAQKKPNFVEWLFQSLHIFLNCKIKIWIILKQLNKFSKKELGKKNVKKAKRIFSWWSFRLKKNKFFIDSVNTIYSCVTQPNPSFLIANLIATYFKTLKRQNFFLKFVEKSLAKQILRKDSFISGIKIKLSGRFNKWPRAKHRFIKIGWGIPVLSVRTKVDYSETTSFTPNGTLGIKVWTLKKTKV